MLSTPDIERWLTPWPIRFKNRTRQWTMKICTLAQAESLAIFWRLHNDDPTSLRSVRWWAEQAKHGKAPAEQHYVHMLAHHRLPVLSNLTILVVWHKKAKRWVVIDGNHHLIAAILVGRLRWRRLRTKLKAVGVVIRHESGIRYPRW